MQEEYEIQWQIPVHYADIPPGVAFVHTPPSGITIRVRDRGSVLLNYTLGRQGASLDISMREMRFLSDSALLLSAGDLEGLIVKQLIPTTHLVSFEPQRIEAPYSKLGKKKLPVYFDGDIRTEPGFQVSGEVTVSPSLAEVYAPDVVLSTLTSIPTVYTEISKGNKTIVRKLKLRRIDGATFDPDLVSVTIPIEEYTQKTLEIPVICRHIPQGYAIRMFPSVVKVSCNVPLSLFKDLSEKDFTVETLVSDPEDNVSGMIPLQLTRKPEWVDRVALSQDSIEFILEQNK
jgi:hypothetical protein